MRQCIVCPQLIATMLFKAIRCSSPCTPCAQSQARVRVCVCVYTCNTCPTQTRQQRYQGRLSVGCLTSQQQASVSQERICSDNFTCCHTEIEVADPTFYLTQSQYTDIGPTSPSADPIMQVSWQGSTGVPMFKILV